MAAEAAAEIASAAKRQTRTRRRTALIRVGEKEESVHFLVGSFLLFYWTIAWNGILYAKLYNNTNLGRTRRGEERDRACGDGSHGHVKDHWLSADGWGRTKFFFC